jgi:membrane-associated protease RseP (regulator of RpoE activity)
LTDYNPYNIEPAEQEYTEPKKKFKLGVSLNLILFIFTFFTTTLAGVAWLNKDPYNLDNFAFGITYAVLILFVLSSHEFGHFFAAKIHKVKVTLPYYIPFPFLFLNPFGTMGAVIRMKSPTQTRKALFDIGIAGPIAGFIASMFILIWGFTHLPTIDYLFNIHPEYVATGIPTDGFSFGNTILFYGLTKIFTSSASIFMPPMSEVYHYPFLCVGWFGLLITALNLLPVGQLDGGHIVYALFKEKHKIVARVFFIITLTMGFMGMLQFIGITWFERYGLLNWVIWSALIYFVIRIDHPPMYDNEPLGMRRILLGWFALFMFVTSFTPVIISY